MATEATAASSLEEVMTAPQVGALLQIPVSTVEDYARRGVLPSLKLGRHRRFVRSEVEATIHELISSRGRLSRRS